MHVSLLDGSEVVLGHENLANLESPPSLPKTCHSRLLCGPIGLAVIGQPPAVPVFPAFVPTTAPAWHIFLPCLDQPWTLRKTPMSDDGKQVPSTGKA